ncbi:phosphatase RsbU N-terminal domain-containing protein [Intrasporangium sp. YIM S08009]|uniref:phosphatase RsbU N-terminal domain-containing protein n=1 Tax=Intrasporangium zincisolvens TaxID=3080018 RepID=UPI002B0540D8|nr:phosphatase RsbU N-terminal domain-containing protein [Intrasporangium sp. YIM S08009]
MTRLPADPDELDRFARNYRPLLLRFLPQRAEEVRAEAYDLGRAAFADGVALLDVCRIHQEVTGEVLSDARPDEVVHVHATSGELLLELLAAYEMTHRAASGR